MVLEEASRSAVRLHPVRVPPEHERPPDLRVAELAARNRVRMDGTQLQQSCNSAGHQSVVYPVRRCSNLKRSGSIEGGQPQ
jgi:hypothetical protein